MDSTSTTSTTRASFGIAFGTPKSRRGSRSVPLADRLFVELAALSKRTLYMDDEALVFANPHTRRPLNVSTTQGKSEPSGSGALGT